MKKIIFWSLIILLIVSIGFNIGLYKRKEYYKNVFPQMLNDGLSNYQSAETALQNGNNNLANLDAGMGLSSMEYAAGYMGTKQLSTNIVALNHFLMTSIQRRTSGKYDSKRISEDKHLFSIVKESFQSFNPTSFSTTELNKDFQKVFDSMNPQQKEIISSYLNE